jgi:signal transduction histidine kinase
VSPDSDIAAIRRALGFGATEEARVREVAPRLVPEIEGWVDAFYERLSADPLALALLKDEATVVRLRRTLTAWFQELLSLPYDAAYERARVEIGRAHVRIGMPQHLMVTAMAGVRRDVRASVRRLVAGTPEDVARVSDAVEMVLDLELALMLGAYRRRAREVAQRTDRVLFARRAEARFARARADAADAAACYAALLRRARDPGSVERWSSRLAEAIGVVADRAGRPGVEERAAWEAPRRVALSDVATRVLEELSVPARTEVEVVVDPPDARVVLFEVPVRFALEELLQNAVNRDPGGSVRASFTALADGGLLLEVSDGGPRWPDSARSVDDAVSAAGGMPAAFCELVTELHGGSIDLLRPPGGGAGVRLRLRPVPEEVAAT